MSLLLTAPERLCLMLKDCHEAVVEAYHFHEDNLDYIKRPCFLVSIGDADYSVSEEDSSEQAAVEESFSIDYIGEPFAGVELDTNHYYEKQAREIAYAAVLYLLKHPNMAFSNDRELEEEPLADLGGILWMRPTSRSSVVLMTRGGNDEAFWGFTIGLTIRSMITDSEEEYIFSGV